MVSDQHIVVKNLRVFRKSSGLAISYIIIETKIVSKAIHKLSQKYWGREEGSKQNFRGHVKKFHDTLQQICENLEGWPKKVRKMPFFGFKKLEVGRVKALDFFRWGVNAKHPHPLPHTPWNHVCLK